MRPLAMRSLVLVTLLLAACGGDEPSGPSPSADTTPPTVPGGIGITVSSPTQIVVSWTASTDANDGDQRSSSSSRSRRLKRSTSSISTSSGSSGSSSSGMW